MTFKQRLLAGASVLALAATLPACGDDSDDIKNIDTNNTQTVECNEQAAEANGTVCP